jgi:hypothetical protein
VYLCVSCNSHNKNRLFPETELSNAGVGTFRAIYVPYYYSSLSYMFRQSTAIIREQHQYLKPHKDSYTYSNKICRSHHCLLWRTIHRLINMWLKSLMQHNGVFEALPVYRSIHHTKGFGYQHAQHAYRVVHWDCENYAVNINGAQLTKTPLFRTVITHAINWRIVYHNKHWLPPRYGTQTIAVNSHKL